MTTQEFLALPSREQDALVAEHIFGFKTELFINCPDCGAKLNNSKTTKKINPFYRMWCGQCSEYKYSPYKEYTTQIQDAWEVIENLQADDACCFELKWYVGEFPWECIFRHHDLVNEHSEFKSHGPTAPLAICIAALKAKGAIE